MDVVAWLLDSDPAIRWQVMRDLADAPEKEVAPERARVASEGWGARLLALQLKDGHWDGGTPTFRSAAGAVTTTRAEGHLVSRMDLHGLELDAVAELRS